MGINQLQLIYFSPQASLFEHEFVFDGGERVHVTAAELDVVRQLGRGAYGTVHLMKHRPTNTNMAVKVCELLFSCKTLMFIVNSYSASRDN